MQNDAGMNVDLYIPRKWRVEKDPEEFMAFVSASAPCNVQGAPLAAGPCDRHLIVRANSSFNSTRAARLRELIPPTSLSFTPPYVKSTARGPGGSSPPRTTRPCRSTWARWTPQPDATLETLRRLRFADTSGTRWVSQALRRSSSASTGEAEGRSADDFGSCCTRLLRPLA